MWLNFKLIQAFMYVIVTCKYERAPIKQPRKRGHIGFPIIALWALPVAMEYRVQSGLAQNLMQHFPHPNDTSDKIWLRSAHLSER